MGDLDLSKESLGLKMYISRNTGLLSNTEEFSFTGRPFQEKDEFIESLVYFIYPAGKPRKNPMGRKMNWEGIISLFNTE